MAGAYALLELTRAHFHLVYVLQQTTIACHYHIIIVQDVLHITPTYQIQSWFINSISLDVNDNAFLPSCWYGGNAGDCDKSTQKTTTLATGDTMTDTQGTATISIRYNGLC